MSLRPPPRELSRQRTHDAAQAQRITNREQERYERKMAELKRQRREERERERRKNQREVVTFTATSITISTITTETATSGGTGPYYSDSPTW